MTHFLNGMLMMSFCVAGLIFLRYWRVTRDRLFLMFSIAFFVMGINRLFLDLLSSADGEVNEHQLVLYLVRLVAFGIILLAMIDKNRSSRQQ